jgi:hypothetical protein
MLLVSSVREERVLVDLLLQSTYPHQPLRQLRCTSYLASSRQVIVVLPQVPEPVTLGNLWARPTPVLQHPSVQGSCPFA